MSPWHCVFTEYNTVKIDFLDPGESLSWDEKAEVLSQHDVNGRLKWKFHRWQRYNKEPIRDWIDKILLLNWRASTSSALGLKSYLDLISFRLPLSMLLALE